MDDRSLQQLLFASPLSGQAVCDDGGRIVRCNPAFARFLRYPAEQLVGILLTELLPDGEELPAASASRRLRFRAGDGRVVWGDACLLAAEGVPHQVLQVYDCTRVQLEQQLHKGRVAVLELLYRENSLEEICEAIVHYVEAIGDGVRCSILQFDPEQGTLHKIAAPSLPDFYNEAIDGMRIGDGVGSCGTAVFRRQRVVVADILSHPYWARARRLVQRTRLRACWSEPIIAHDGAVLGSFALYYETPREPQAEELDLIAAAASLTAIAISHKRAEQALRDLDRTRDEFISMAAHELRTPLTAIMGFSEFLAVGCEDAGLQREVAGAIHERGIALARLIDDLLDASSIQLGRGLLVEAQPQPLVPLLERAVAAARCLSPRHQVELALDIPPDQQLTCDAGRLAQVLANLLENAIKYSPNGGLVSLSARGSEQGLVFAVTDQGVGMSAVEKRRAFDRFFRARSDGSAPPGLGLGLCIVRQIVEAHGGSIDLVSSPGAGTCVTFLLPH